MRVGVTTADQCLASASNFAVGVAVARISNITGLGAYALAYAAWLVLQSLHRSLVTEPMAIEGDVRHPQASAKLGAGLAAELCLGLAGGAVFSVGAFILLSFGEHEFGIILLALAPWLPLLLIQDYWRWVGFMQGRPAKALANDVVFNLVQVATFAVLFLGGGIRSPVVAITAWGLGAASGAVFGFWQFSVRPTGRGGLSLLRDRWHISRWLAAESVTDWGASQSYLVLAGGILGPAALGSLKAAQSLVIGPSQVLVQAGGSIGLPEASRAMDERGWRGLQRVARAVSAVGVLSVGLIGAVVVVFGRTFIRFTYGPEFSHFSSTAGLLAVAYIIGAVGLGPILTLKVTKQTRALFQVQVVALVVSTASVTALAVRWGVVGAAGAVVVTGAANLVGWLKAYRRTARAAAGGREAVEVAAP
jgi:O-antigen/teichoic acid export membrane protein